MLTASQHGNEQSAKEAALRLIRDVASSDLKPLLEALNLVVMPQCNPYGNWADVRENEIGLDMNRDHVKLESEGVRAIHRAFRAYMPEVTLDVHEQGDNYYRVSIGCVSNLNADPALQELSRRTILAEVDAALAKQRVTFFEYLVTQEMGLDSSAGVRYRQEELAGRARMTRYSTTDLNDGRNSLGIFQTLSFIQEGASRHDLETLRDRTDWQYAGLRAFASVRGLERGEDRPAGAADSGLRTWRVHGPSAPASVHLRMEYARDAAQPTLSVRRFTQAESPIRGVLKSDKKAGEPVAAADLAEHPYPAKVKVVDEAIQNWFPGVESRLQVARPRGYLLPGRLQEAVETLLRHGIEVSLFTRDQEVDGQVYDVTEVTPARLDYLPPERIEVGARDLRTLARKGDFYVSTRTAWSESGRGPSRAAVSVRADPVRDVRARPADGRGLRGAPHHQAAGPCARAVPGLGRVTAPEGAIMLSVVVPVYRNETSIPDLLEEIEGVQRGSREDLRSGVRGGRQPRPIGGDPRRGAGQAALRLAAPRPEPQLRLVRRDSRGPACREGRRLRRHGRGPAGAAGAGPGDAAEARRGRVRHRRRRSGEPRRSPSIPPRLRRVLVAPPPRRPARGAEGRSGRLRLPRARSETTSWRCPEQNSSLIGLLFWLGFRRTEVRYRAQDRRCPARRIRLRRRPRLPPSAWYRNRGRVATPGLGNLHCARQRATRAARAPPLEPAPGVDSPPANPDGGSVRGDDRNGVAAALAGGTPVRQRPRRRGSASPPHPGSGDPRVPVRDVCAFGRDPRAAPRRARVGPRGGARGSGHPRRLAAGVREPAHSAAVAAS